jgi:hypothetical protein
LRQAEEMSFISIERSDSGQCPKPSIHGPPDPVVQAARLLHACVWHVVVDKHLVSNEEGQHDVQQIQACLAFAADHDKYPPSAISTGSRGIIYSGLEINRMEVSPISERQAIPQQRS